MTTSSEGQKGITVVSQETELNSVKSADQDAQVIAKKITSLLAEYNSVKVDKKKREQTSTVVNNIIAQLKNLLNEDRFTHGITKELLEESKLGVEVNKMRKAFTLVLPASLNEDEQEVNKLATELLTGWKEVMLGGKFSSPLVLKRSTSENNDDDSVDSQKRIKLDISSKSSANLSNTSSSVSYFPTKLEDIPDDSLIKNFLTGDSTRDKCFEMLVSALLTDQLEQSKGNAIIKTTIVSGTTTKNGLNITNASAMTSFNLGDELTFGTARAIEECLYKEFQGITSAPYKNKFRSKYLNLKASHSVALRASLLQGIITPSRFIMMTPAEMASEERRRQDALLMEANLREAQAARDTEAETDQFKCGRCKQRKCKYYQLQTRSADEPMTTFVTCINCGNKWKFC